MTRSCSQRRGWMRVHSIVALYWIAGALPIGASDTPRQPEPALVTFPHSAAAWDAACDRSGGIHVVFVDPEDASVKYIRSVDQGVMWTTPSAIPDGGRVVTIGGMERGPRLAVVDNAATPEQPVIALAWQSKEHIVFTRSEDGGATWTMNESIRDADAPGGIDMLAMTTGPDGRIALIWNDSRAMRPGPDRVAGCLVAATSEDGGRTFGRNIILNDRPSALADSAEPLPGACVCCLPDGMFDGAGNLFVAYRTSASHIKEIGLVRLGADGAVRFTQVSRDRWEMHGCPMNGPEIAVSADGERVAIVWNREREIRAALSADGGTSFSAHCRLGEGAWHEASVIGEILVLLWEDGGKVRLGSVDPDASLEDAITLPRRGVLVTDPAGRPILVTGR